jgi:hypothetical protein
MSDGIVAYDYQAEIGDLRVMLSVDQNITLA